MSNNYNDTLLNGDHSQVYSPDLDESEDGQAFSHQSVFVKQLQETSQYSLDSKKGIPRRSKHDLTVYTREGTVRKRPQYRSYTQEDLREAIRLVQEESLPQRTVCQRLGIPRTTLHDHICRVSRSGHHAPADMKNEDSDDLLPNQGVEGNTYFRVISSDHLPTSGSSNTDVAGVRENCSST